MCEKLHCILIFSLLLVNSSFFVSWIFTRYMRQCCMRFLGSTGDRPHISFVVAGRGYPVSHDSYAFPGIRHAATVERCSVEAGSGARAAADHGGEVQLPGQPAAVGRLPGPHPPDLRGQPRVPRVPEGPQDAPLVPHQPAGRTQGAPPRPLLQPPLPAPVGHRAHGNAQVFEPTPACSPSHVPGGGGPGGGGGAGCRTAAWRCAAA